MKILNKKEVNVIIIALLLLIIIQNINLSIAAGTWSLSNFDSNNISTWPDKTSYPGVDLNTKSFFLNTIKENLMKNEEGRQNFLNYLNTMNYDNSKDLWQYYLDIYEKEPKELKAFYEKFIGNDKQTSAWTREIVNTISKGKDNPEVKNSVYYTELWNALDLKQQQQLLKALNEDIISTTPTTPDSIKSRNELLFSVLSEKYKKLETVTLATSNVELNDKNELVVKDKSGKETFRIPMNPPDIKIRLVKIEAVNIPKGNEILINNLQLTYDPQGNSKPEEYRTIIVQSGSGGSINPVNGNYIDISGKETEVNLLYGSGGAIAVYPDGNGGVAFGMMALNLNPADKKIYDEQGAIKLANTPVIKIGNNYVYGSNSLEVGVTVKDGKISFSNGEMLVTDGKESVAYISNIPKGEYVTFSSGTDATPAGNHEVKLITGADGKLGLNLGANAKAGINLYKDINMENIRYPTGSTTTQVAISNDGKPVAMINEQGVSVASPELNPGLTSCNPSTGSCGSVSCDGNGNCGSYSCDGNGRCGFIPGHPLYNIGVAVGGGLGGVARGTGAVLGGVARGTGAILGGTVRGVGLVGRGIGRALFPWR